MSSKPPFGTADAGTPRPLFQRQVNLCSRDRTRGCAHRMKRQRAAFSGSTTGGDSVNKRKNLVIALAIGAFVAASAAHAEYPERSVRVIVGQSPGGGTDSVARV